jgi:hypothetical protein
MADRLRGLALTVSLACAALGCGSDKVLLRYHPKANSTHRYALDEQMKLAGAGAAAQLPAMDMGMSVQLRERVGESNRGGVTGTAVTWSVDTLTFRAPAGMDAASPALASQIARVKAMSFDLVYDDRRIPLHVQVHDPLGEASAEGRRVTGNVEMFNYPLPVAPVGKGDHWRVETEIPLPQAGGPISVQSVLTVKDITVADGDTTVVFTVSTQFPDRPIAISGMGRTMTMKLSGTITGEQAFSLSQGMVLDAAVSGTIKMAMAVPGLPSVPLSLSLDMQATLKRLAGP